MKIAVLGTGDVGRRLATKLAGLGHEVTLGSRTAANEKAVAWASESSGRHGTFADAAAGAELVINATKGENTIAALTAAGAENLAGKVLIDVSNGLDLSEGFPPKVVQPDGRSLGELVQATFPEALVVKTLNTLSNVVMVDPARVPGDHVLFLSGNDADAKLTAQHLLKEFGWRDEQFIDLGDITTARGTEHWLALWVRLFAKLGSPDFNLEIRRS